MNNVLIPIIGYQHQMSSNQFYATQNAFTFHPLGQDPLALFTISHMTWECNYEMPHVYSYLKNCNKFSKLYFRINFENCSSIRVVFVM